MNITSIFLRISYFNFAYILTIFSFSNNVVWDLYIKNSYKEKITIIFYEYIFQCANLIYVMFVCSKFNINSKKNMNFYCVFSLVFSLIFFIQVGALQEEKLEYTDTVDNKLIDLINVLYILMIIYHSVFIFTWLSLLSYACGKQYRQINSDDSSRNSNNSSDNSSNDSVQQEVVVNFPVSFEENNSDVFDAYTYAFESMVDSNIKLDIKTGDENNDENENENEKIICQICLENSSDRYLPCCHKLCDGCYFKIIEMNRLCPFCRTPF